MHYTSIFHITVACLNSIYKKLHAIIIIILYNYITYYLTKNATFTASWFRDKCRIVSVMLNRPYMLAYINLQWLIVPNILEFA